MIYTTSDTHFNHENILKYCPQSRPFDSVAAMNEAIIERWNSVVKPEDTVIHCGDFFMGAKTDIAPILDRLNGKILLVRGNHDSPNRISVYKEHGIEVKDIHYLWYKDKLFLCTHYQMIVSNGECDKHIFNLHGHTHQTASWSQYPRCYHVGVDSNNLYPISIEKIYIDTDNYVQTI